MTSTDTAGHPDVAEISDLTEGLLPPARSADIRRHLDVCELCADVHASLEEIRGLLGTLPGPTHMPPDVEGRIDAALAAEALLSSTAPHSAEAPHTAETPNTASALDTPEPSGGSGGDKRTHVSRETAVPNDRPAGHARTSTTGPGRKNHRRKGRRRLAALGAVLTVVALGLGSVLMSTLGDGKQSDDTAQARQSASADTFSKEKLESQVAALLAKNESGGSSRTPESFGVESAPGSGEPRVLKEPVVPTCVREGIGRNDSALAAEEGIFRGSEAMLVVLPDPADATRVTAYLVDAACVDQPSASFTAKVLLKESYPRS